LLQNLWATYQQVDQKQMFFSDDFCLNWCPESKWVIQMIKLVSDKVLNFLTSCVKKDTVYTRKQVVDKALFLKTPFQRIDMFKNRTLPL